MKGIAHFTIGIAAASSFPAAVAAGAAGNPLYFILGAVFGLLPDTLDFKLYRFLYRHDIEITPDPHNPDPQSIADCLANAFMLARETGKPVRVKLNTIRLGADLWQQYHVSFSTPDQSVTVSCGPVVNTGGSPVPTPAPDKHPIGRARLPCPVKIDYLAVTTVDIFDGPRFEMLPTTDGRVTPRFSPWHREWSHSLVIALLFALMGAAIWTPLAGAVILAAWTLHIVADQLGFMGSSLWFPFKRRRTPGFGVMHSGRPVWNLLAVWLSCIIIFWNLYANAPWQADRFNFITLCLYALLLPAAIYGAARRWIRRRDH